MSLTFSRYVRVIFHVCESFPYISHRADWFHCALFPCHSPCTPLVFVSVPVMSFSVPLCFPAELVYRLAMMPFVYTLSPHYEASGWCACSPRHRDSSSKLMFAGMDMVALQMLLAVATNIGRAPTCVHSCVFIPHPPPPPLLVAALPPPPPQPCSQLLSTHHSLAANSKKSTKSTRFFTFLFPFRVQDPLSLSLRFWGVAYMQCFRLQVFLTASDPQKRHQTVARCRVGTEGVMILKT